VHDWVAANAINNLSSASPYGYAEINARVTPQVHASALPFRYEGLVRQYGADYIAIESSTQDALQVSFAGQPEVRLVPNDPASGRYQWWSNRGDASHSLLERSFRLSGVSTATLSYDLWYDIEPGWDYAYVRASGDGGVTWSVLQGQQGSDYDPAGNALGWGYTGRSGTQPATAIPGLPRWVRDSVDLSAFAGKPVLVRFDYVTDEAVNSVGLCLDNLALEAIGYSDDVEQGEQGWRSDGFIRHDNRLPQAFDAQLITLGEEPRVQALKVDTSGRGDWLLAPDDEGGAPPRILAITALAPVTTEPATYTLRIEHVAQASH
jgi:immune inhibitor A